MGPLTLPSNGLVYLDAQMIIYAVEAREPFAEALMPLWQAIARGELTAATSELTWLEVLVRPLREGDHERLEEFRQALSHPQLRVQPITLQILRAAADLRAARATLRTPDAIHLATALAAGCATFLTNDLRLRDVGGLTVSHLTR